MFVSEACGGRLPELVKEREEKKFITDLVTILEVISPEMQVLDVFLNRPFREHIKIMNLVNVLYEDYTYTFIGNFKKSPSAMYMDDLVLSFLVTALYIDSKSVSNLEGTVNSVSRKRLN